MARPPSASLTPGEVDLARIAYFYGLDPLAMPAWFLDVLLDSLPAVQAETRRQTIMDGRMAQFAKPSALERWLYILEQEMRPWPKPPEQPSVPYEERDPEKAAEWFGSRGVVVVPTPDNVKKNGPH